MEENQTTTVAASEEVEQLQDLLTGLDAQSYEAAFNNRISKRQAEYDSAEEAAATIELTIARSQAMCQLALLRMWAHFDKDFVFDREALRAADQVINTVKSVGEVDLLRRVSSEFSGFIGEYAEINLEAKWMQYQPNLVVSVLKNNTFFIPVEKVRPIIFGNGASLESLADEIAERSNWTAADFAAMHNHVNSPVAASQNNTRLVDIHQIQPAPPVQFLAAMKGVERYANRVSKQLQIWQRSSGNEPREYAMIAEYGRKYLSALYGADLKFDITGVKHLCAAIELLRPSGLSQDDYKFHLSWMRSFFGKCLIATYGGTWSLRKGRYNPLVAVNHSLFVSPDQYVKAQFENGRGDNCVIEKFKAVAQVLKNGDSDAAANVPDDNN